MHAGSRLSAQGYRFMPASAADRADFIRVKMTCYRAYVEQYYGPWDEDDQIRRNGALFDSILCEPLYKITLHGETVGFWGFREEEALLSGFHMQLLPNARGQGVGSCILAYMAALSAQKRKPVRLKVFRSNPALHLYERFGFRIISANDSHFFMQLDMPGPQARKTSGGSLWKQNVWAI